MTEYDEFMNSIKDKSESTKKQYRLQYNKLFKLLGKPIAETSEKKIIELLDTVENKNASQALLNIAFLIRKLYGLSIKVLEKRRSQDKERINKDVKLKNVELKENLPSYDSIIEYMNHLYDKSEWTDYIINYLLINVQVRNQDLDFTIVSRRKDANDETKNYMWLQNNKAKATYIRNVYKTAKIITPDGSDHGYGKKTNVITDVKFITALRRVLGCQKSELECGVFIPNKSAISYYISKATYKQLGEGKYLKIIIDHFKNDIDKLKEISANRGSDLKTLLTSYNINNI